MSTEQLGFDFAREPRSQRAPTPAVRPQPFNYTEALREVVTDIVGTLEELKHVDLERTIVAVSQARQQSKHGVYASCLPLRFEGGSRETVIRKVRYRMPEVRNPAGVEALYILYFMLPRFHEETDYAEKLATVIHELYHISPLFNGDLRRFPGKNYAHGHSRERYHAAMRVLASKYLDQSPRADTHEFLKLPFAELTRRPGGLVVSCIEKPRLIPVGTVRR